MDAIAFTKSIQKKFNQRVKKLKGKIVKGDIKVAENGILPSKKDRGRGVIYLGHIPHGFYEDQMLEYFGQFGIVTKIRLARSAKTGRSKGYAFVEFKSAEVASIVAETMNNYLMYDKILKCRVVPREEQHKAMFINTITADKFPKQGRQAKDTASKNKVLQLAEEEKLRRKKLRQIAAFRRFFEDRGIEFNFKVNDPNGLLQETYTNGNGVAHTDTTYDSDTSIDSSETEDDAEEFGVLEIDESDDDIEFKTPPQVKKIIKRSSTSLPLPKVKTLNGSTSKFPKIEWADSRSGKGVGKKFQNPVQVKEKPKLAKSFKPMMLKKADKVKKAKAFKVADAQSVKKVGKKVVKETQKKSLKKKEKSGRVTFGVKTRKMPVM